MREDAARRRADPALEPARRDHRAARATSASGAGVRGARARARAAAVMFVETPLGGRLVVEPERLARRARATSRAPSTPEFERTGSTAVVQCNTSFNAARRHAARHALPGRAARRGQARALHARRDLRRGRRPAAGLADATARWFGVELSADNGRALYMPARLRARLPDARGRLRGALPDVHAVRPRRRRAACAGTTRRSASTWPEPPAGGRVMSERDAAYPDV